LDYGKFFVFNSKDSNGNLLNPGDYLTSADILEGKVFYTTMSGFRPYTIPSGKPNRFNQIFQQSLTEEYFIFSTEGYRSYYDETFPETGTAYIGFECLNGDKELIIEDITDTFYVRGDITNLDNQNYQYAHNNIQERYNNTYTISNTIFDEIDINNSFDTRASSKLFLWIRNNNLENK
jgi:hypothetical protein